MFEFITTMLFVSLILTFSVLIIYMISNIHKLHIHMRRIRIVDSFHVTVYATTHIIKYITIINYYDSDRYRHYKLPVYVFDSVKYVDINARCVTEKDIVKEICKTLKVKEYMLEYAADEKSTYIKINHDACEVEVDDEKEYKHKPPGKR